MWVHVDVHGRSRSWRVHGGVALGGFRCRGRPWRICPRSPGSRYGELGASTVVDLVVARHRSRKRGTRPSGFTTGTHTGNLSSGTDSRRDREHIGERFQIHDGKLRGTRTRKIPGTGMDEGHRSSSHTHRTETNRGSTSWRLAHDVGQQLGLERRKARCWASWRGGVGAGNGDGRGAGGGELEAGPGGGEAGCGRARASGRRRTAGSGRSRGGRAAEAEVVDGDGREEAGLARRGRGRARGALGTEEHGGVEVEGRQGDGAGDAGEGGRRHGGKARRRDAATGATR